MGIAGSWLSGFWNTYIRNMDIIDILDIAIITFFLYKLLWIIRGKSAARVVRAVVILLLITWISELIGLNAVCFLLSNAIRTGLIALVVMFQPEIRRALERVGSGSKLGRFLGKSAFKGEMAYVVDQTVEACGYLTRSRHGALIAFERDINLDDSIKTGIALDANVSSELLSNIFYPKASLHDGAVIIRGGRIAAAGCVLPLSANTNLNRDLGTRHRAGVGLSEQSDSVIVIVSEERGTVSVAVGGMIKMNLSLELLKKLLLSELDTEGSQKTLIKDRFKIFRRRKDAQ